jgi:hypothetical protein
MSQTEETLQGWLGQAGISQERLSAQQLAVLNAAFRFRQQQGPDYYSSRLLGHFLLHGDTGLKVAAIARLLGISRPTASAQQGIPSKDVIRSAAHRMAGRPYGKLLPRHAGPVAQYLLGHPEATRIDLLQFLKDTFSVSVSRVALHKFLKKYGLEQIGRPTSAPLPSGEPQDSTAAGQTPSAPLADSAATGGQPLIEGSPGVRGDLLPLADSADTPGQPLILLPTPRIEPAALPPPPFSSDGRSTPEPSC